MLADVFWELLEHALWNIWSRCWSLYYRLRITMASILKKANVKIDLLANMDMLLMMKEGIKSRICHVIHWYANGNNKYIKNYDKNKKPSDLKCWNVNNLYGWSLPESLPANIEKLHDHQNGLPFTPERLKI